MKHNFLKLTQFLAFTLLGGGILLTPQYASWSETLKPQNETDTLTNVLQNLKSNIQKVTLKNGIRLLMMKRSYAPVASMYIKFYAGGSDETPQTAGIAHMLEHMLFKGTRTIGTRDYEREKKYLEVSWRWAREMDEWRRKADQARAAGNEDEATKADEEAGKWSDRLESIQHEARSFMVMDEDSYIYSLHGQRGYNAYTSRDLTNYQIELPVNRMEVWARLESDRFQNSVLRDFYTERNVVAEERRMRVDNVSSNLLMEQFLKAAYGDHPYGQSLIGSMKSIQYLNHEMADQFYDTYYASNNMIITVVGDIDFDETRELIEKFFGKMEPRRIPRNSPIEPETQKNLHLELKRDGSPFQIMAWFKPPMPDPDDLKLELLSEILAGSRDSRLFRKLVLEKRSAAQVNIYSSYPGERYTNLFLVMGVPAPGRSYDEVQADVLEEIRKIRDEGVTQEELERVRASIESKLIYSLRSNSSMADRLSYYETLTGDYGVMFDTYEDLPKITVQDLKDVAGRYLQESKMMTARLIAPDKPDASATGEEKK